MEDMKKYLTNKNITSDIFNRAKKIKLLGVDVDGVLSDGRVFLSDKYGEELKSFSAKDALGMKQLKKIGIELVMITARKSNIVAMRAKELEIDLCFQGREMKLPVMEDIMQKMNLTWENIAYIGDDLTDVPILKKAGLAATPSDGNNYVKDISMLVCENAGGCGAVREVIDLILIAQNKMQDVINSYV